MGKKILLSHLTSLTFALLVLTPVATDAATGYGGYTGGGSSASSYVPRPTLVEPANAADTVAASPSISFNTDLRKGQTSPAVVELQERLRAAGFFKYPVSTGFFGPITLDAVKRFQKFHLGYSTGFVGPLTRAALNK